MENQNHIIKGGKVITANGAVHKDLHIEHGIIKEIAVGLSGTNEIDARGKIIIPGFVDIHNHGAAGFDFSFGKYLMKEDTFLETDSAFASGLKSALDFYLSSGVTKVYLTSMAAPVDRLTNAFKQLDLFLEQNPIYQDLVGGINVEGTFLKDPAYAGAQNPKFFYALDRHIIDELQAASGHRIKIINIPPEHGVNALSTIKEVTDQGIVVAAGHTACYGDQLERAIESGLTLGVHFLNGPARSSYKSFHKGGAQEMMLQSDDMFLEIITDGYHVAPSYFRDVLARKGADRIISITDSMFANGLDKLKKFTLFGLEGAVSQNGEYLNMLNSEDTLFGSVLRSDTAYNNVRKWLRQPIAGVWHRHHSALSEEQATQLASQFLTANPARLLGIYETLEQRVGTGSIEVGKWADLVIGKIEGDQFEVERTMSHGEVLWDAT